METLAYVMIRNKPIFDCDFLYDCKNFYQIKMYGKIQIIKTGIFLF